MLFWQEPRKVKRPSLKGKKAKGETKSDGNKTEEGESSEGNRHSCDELMMTRSLYVGKNHEGEPVGASCSGGAEGEVSDSGSHKGHHGCQRCLLNTLSNRTMSLDCDELINR